MTESTKSTKSTNSIKIDLKLPPHELNARRNRKRTVTQLPAVACLPPAPDSRAAHRRHKAKHADSGNQVVYSPATNPVNDPGVPRKA